MSATSPENPIETTPEYSGVEFARSAEGFPLARVDDIVMAMLPGGDGVGLLASAWRIFRPLAELKRADFYIYESTLTDEAAFRSRVLETVEHKRELRGLSRRDMRVHCSTPWGPSQGATIYAEGIVSHSTAGHGGFKLSGTRNRKVHPMLRAEDGWYEEDAAWAIVAITFPHLFTSYERRCAERTIRDSWPDAWETISGIALKCGESFEKDRRAFEQEHAGNWIVISAIRSDHEHGFVEVVATLGGCRAEQIEERRFLVPCDEYKVGRFGFVIDEARYRAYDGPSDFIGWQRRASP
ncbi:hypothetical protein RHEC894_PC00088 (plasmid) [Rhizobium sp. CIAT894]|uniref:DUF7007 domain-containing protein n=1 Tax=Rhizobium sp. CIAT894 TaxID=2020312 RepID=UPI000A1E47F3|nr:hypothetical protein [Rhizobium sp. CIAT894]ARM91123.1 hypothetical protein RHEC894_PC00088 [Rhizobium sp. CIAT894]